MSTDPGDHRTRCTQLSFCVLRFNEVWTLPTFDSSAGKLIAEAFRANGLDVPHTTVIVNNAPVQRDLVASGRFVTMVPAELPMVARNPLIKILPINLPMTRRPIASITVKGRTVSPVAHVFIECAREVAKSIRKLNLM